MTVANRRLRGIFGRDEHNPRVVRNRGDWTLRVVLQSVETPPGCPSGKQPANPRQSRKGCRPSGDAVSLCRGCQRRSARRRASSLCARVSLSPSSPVFCRLASDTALPSRGARPPKRDDVRAARASLDGCGARRGSSLVDTARSGVLQAGSRRSPVSRGRGVPFGRVSWAESMAAY